ncbi:MAG: chemotaxis protein CheW [Pseudobdellovibrio sp.]
MTEVDKYLSFNLGQESFAMPLLKVREVIGMPEVTPVPQAIAHVLGIMNLRGQIITIFDMRTCLKLKASQKSDTTVIICEMEFGQIGMIVDSVNSVLSVSKSELSEVPVGSKSAGQSYITNVYRREQELTLMLDVEHLITTEAKVQVQQLTKKTA